MRYPAYPEYKESGVQWLGRVPGHWGVKSARFDYAIQLGKMLQPEASSLSDQETPYLKAQHVQWESVRTTDSPTMWASQSDRNKYGVCDGDLLVCEGGDVGRAGIVRNPPDATIIQNALHRVRSRNADLRYLMFVLEHAASQNWFEILCNRSTIAHFTGEKFGALQVPAPPLPEQTAIADFLDRETGRIDTLVAKKRRLVALLKEKRTALISRIVTRGLPQDAAREFGLEPHTRFKDSGIEWLGQVPEGWDLKKVKYVAKVIIGITYSPDDVVDESEGILVLRASNVQNGKLSFNDNVYVEKKIKDSDRVKQGDILICSRNGSAHLVGKCAYITAEHSGYTFGAFMSVVRSDYGLYLYQFFNSDIFKAQSGLFNTSTINQLTSSTLENMVVAFPPKKEQTAIATYLDRETAKIDKLVEKVEAAIARLQEYRIALITAAVTGKIDVREAVT
ncbi:restriction endonuclease subunit S [Sedimenticola thiotaurini]|uniref:restriction endonuclease subunit S n=1 Tax=Sedimenticola thiotaurini TaxID=1543721 RepID=UPI000699B2D9|nr:restriction endonuclease subunit S [Sedimenticola thiotaurini]